jgi:hypothetical protein
LCLKRACGSFGTTPRPNLSGPNPIAVSKHGRVIGFYVPLERDEEEVRRAVASLGDTVSQVLKETGMVEDELAEQLDVRRPRAQ